MEKLLIDAGEKKIVKTRKVGPLIRLLYLGRSRHYRHGTHTCLHSANELAFEALIGLGHVDMLLRT